MSDAGTAGSIAFFAAVAAIVLVPMWLRNRVRVASMKLVSDAIAKGQPLDAATIERAMTPPKDNFAKWFAMFCLFLGVSGLSVAIPLMLGGRVVAEQTGRSHAEMLLATFVTGFTGLGHTGLGVVILRLFNSKQKPGVPKDGLAVAFGLICLWLGVAALSTAVALMFASFFLGAQLDEIAAIEHAHGGILLGAMITAGSGLGFTALGIVTLRWLGDDRDA